MGFVQRHGTAQSKVGESMKQGSFLKRLRRDQTGNVMYLTAGLLVPIMATIGSGVDLGQAYMAKSRLQQACDAGVLAGRKAMAENDFDADAQTAADNMFQFNYPEGIYDSTGVTFTPTQRSNTEVTANATATVNTVIMHMFGKESFNLAVNCTAKLEISNADIMFVLDVTGSMSNTNSGDTVNRITALRTETMAFFDTIMGAEAGDSQIRIGVVPYSTNANVGGILRAANPSWLSDNLTLPSREANFDTIDPPETSTDPAPVWSSVSGFSTWTNTGVTMSGRNSSNCSSTPLSPEYTTSTTRPGFPQTTTNTTNGSNGSTTTTTTVTTEYNALRFRWRWSSNACREQSAPGVRRSVDVSTETNNPPYQVFRDYTYKNRTFNVRPLINGTAMNLPLGTAGASVSLSYDGCILERDTVAFDDAVATIPAAAYDIDIDLLPTSEATRWHALVPKIGYARSSNMNNSGQSPSPTNLTTTNNWVSMSTNVNCPAAAMKLTTMTSANRSTFQTYLNTLQPTGATFHDVGMVWGARLISPTGLFAAQNTSAPNGSAISRHIIFMTDGEPNPDGETLSMHGYEQLMQRIGTNDHNEKIRRHNRRWMHICDQAKSRNITVWTVSFGTALTTEMRNCASGDKSFQANNAAQLRAQFQAIAQQITRLRLSE